MKNPLKNDPVGFFILAVVGLLLLCAISITAHAKPVDLGKFGDYNYYYEEASILYLDNTRIVWVGTLDPRFNLFHDENYKGAVGQIAVDCSGHNSAFVAGIIFDDKGNALHQRSIPDQDWAFFSIEPHTVQDRLYRILCVLHTAI